MTWGLDFYIDVSKPEKNAKEKQHKYREESMREKNIFLLMQLKVPLLREVQGSSSLTSGAESHWVRGAKFRNHTLLVFVDGLTCYLPSYSSAPTRVPLPVKKRNVRSCKGFRTIEELQVYTWTACIQNRPGNNTVIKYQAQSWKLVQTWAGEKSIFFPHQVQLFHSNSYLVN